MNLESAMFGARGLSKRYARRDFESAALVEVSIEVPRGGFMAVTGPSGGGKTTLLTMLGVLDRPTTGRVFFDGEDLEGTSDAHRARVRRRIGFVFQNSPMIRALPVFENVTYSLIPTGVTPRARRDRAAACLARVGLEGMLDRRPEELSGGELQRVGIARALVANPSAVLADEPTSNLDAASAEAVATILREIHREGTTVLVATHDPRLVALATTVIALEAGRLRGAAQPAERPS